MHPDAPLRRLTIWLATLGYAIVAGGLPLPSGVAPPPTGAARRPSDKDRSRPFPCMDTPCGCDSADRCFTSCCCHSPAETLAWARAHGVEAGVLVALERRVARGPSAIEEEGSCCAAKSAAACCEERAAPATTSRAFHEAGDDGGGEPATSDAPAPRRQRMVTLKALLACGGIVAQWCAVAGALPPPRVEAAAGLPCVGRWITTDAIGAGQRPLPEPPPPRAA